MYVHSKWVCQWFPKQKCLPTNRRKMAIVANCQQFLKPNDDRDYHKVFLKNVVCLCGGLEAFFILFIKNFLQELHLSAFGWQELLFWKLLMCYRLIKIASFKIYCLYISNGCLWWDTSKKRMQTVLMWFITAGFEAFVGPNDWMLKAPSSREVDRCSRAKKRPKVHSKRILGQRGQIFTKNDYMY